MIDCTVITVRRSTGKEGRDKLSPSTMTKGLSNFHSPNWFGSFCQQDSFCYTAQSLLSNPLIIQRQNDNSRRPAGLSINLQP